ncbi:DsbA family oxidoreductase [Marinomonas balearica]|uniref:Putative DsbA family dithiol-disulfide isomerase n=1 Tax=Marinomonas balearica TaxID=491947 RepID=A0A4R6MFN5_9GAMM|nr:DsbA family oxidoreductase [Marinomonas balearica]TDP00484.1 putative DsbA family dithiol-disulfide isomerase [Marinomonas balearica]
MSSSLNIQFVSDVMCPWCVVGLGNLNKALGQLDETISVDLSFQPFELNPNMPSEGQNVREHVIEKYGITEQESDQNRTMIQSRGKEVDFDFNFTADSRMRNSFGAHRLLHWAGIQGKQAELKAALFKAHFTHNQDISDYSVLANLAASVDLNSVEAKTILETQQYADDVREQVQFWKQNGISSVPTVIINNKYAISGGQPVDVFKNALEEILAKDVS